MAKLLHLTSAPGGFVGFRLDTISVECRKPSKCGHLGKNPSNHPIWKRGEHVYTDEVKMEFWGDDPDVRHFGTDEEFCQMLPGQWKAMSPSDADSCFFLSDGFKVVTVGLSVRAWSMVRPKKIYVPAKCVIPETFLLPYQNNLSNKIPERMGLRDAQFLAEGAHLSAAVSLRRTGLFQACAIKMGNQSSEAKILLWAPIREVTEAEFNSIGYTTANGIPAKYAIQSVASVASGLLLRGSMQDVLSAIEVRHAHLNWGITEGSIGVVLGGGFLIRDAKSAAVLSGIDWFSHLPSGATVRVLNSRTNEMIPLSEDSFSCYRFSENAEFYYCDGRPYLSINSIARIGGVSPIPSAANEHEIYSCDCDLFEQHFMPAKKAHRLYAIPHTVRPACVVRPGVDKVQVMGFGMLSRVNESYPLAYLASLPKRGAANREKRMVNDAIIKEIKDAIGAIPEGFERGKHSAFEALETANVVKGIHELTSFDEFVTEVYKVIGGEPCVLDEPFRDVLIEHLKSDGYYAKAFFGPHIGQYVPCCLTAQSFVVKHAAALYKAIGNDVYARIIAVLGQPDIQDALLASVLLGQDT